MNHVEKDYTVVNTMQTTAIGGGLPFGADVFQIDAPFPISDKIHNKVEDRPSRSNLVDKYE